MTAQQREDIIAFLEAPADPGRDRTIPARVPSGLTPGGNRRFLLSGAMTSMLRKEDGRWFFVSGHTSYLTGAAGGTSGPGEGR